MAGPVSLESLLGQVGVLASTDALLTRQILDDEQAMLAGLVSPSERMELEKAAAGNRDKLAAALDAVKESGDVPTMLQAQRTVLWQNRWELADTRSMISSLDRALRQVDAALQTCRVLYKQPDLYREVFAVAFSLKENRVHGVPKDECRQFLKSQLARLENADRHERPGSARKVLVASRALMLAAQACYNIRQHEAFGTELTGSGARGQRR